MLILHMNGNYIISFAISITGQLFCIQQNILTKEKIFDKVRASVTGVLEINEIIDPSLIGGFIIRMDDKQIDASISSQLSNLKQRLTR